MHVQNEQKDLRKLMVKSSASAESRRSSLGSAIADVGRMEMPEVKDMLSEVKNEHRYVVLRRTFPFMLVPPEAALLDAWNMVRYSTFSSIVESERHPPPPRYRVVTLLEQQRFSCVTKTATYLTATGHISPRNAPIDHDPR
jgi:hypothetical protein